MHPTMLRPCAAALLVLRVGVDHAAEIPTLPAVDVVGVTAVPGTDRAARPHSVERTDARRRRDAALAEPQPAGGSCRIVMPSVNVNEIQGNPFQFDVNYRGFTASPLLGTPQGLSVFQDGVRVNEPFGDIVNWDLIPMIAVESISLVPGSNPLFGLNTLGGALVAAYEERPHRAGDRSDGLRRARSAGAGRSRARRPTRRHALLRRRISGLEEDGWRDYSPSRVRNAFRKWDSAQLVRVGLRAHVRKTTVSSATASCPSDARTCGASRSTRARIETRNELLMFALNASYWLTPAQRLSALALSALEPHAHAQRRRERRLRGSARRPDRRWRTARRRVSARTGSRFSGAISGRAQSISPSAPSYDRSRSRFQQTEAEGAFDPTRAGRAHRSRGDRCAAPPARRARRAST